MTDCIFCKVANGEAKGYLVYDDGYAVAFLDIRPAAPGHVLVVPKQHYENIFDIPQDVLSHVYSTVKKIAEAQKKAFSATGVKVAQNNGKEAGQIVFHFHTHVVPITTETKTDLTEEEFNFIAEELKKNLVSQ